MIVDGAAVNNNEVVNKLGNLCDTFVKGGLL
jgi:hypothetical protein